MEEIKLHQFAEKLALLGYSKRTCNEYPKQVKQFALYLEDKEQVKSFYRINSAHIKGYQTYLQFAKVNSGKALALKTVCGILGAIKTFYQVMHREGLLETDLSIHVQLPIIRKRIPRNVPNTTEVVKLLDTVSSDKLIWIRDRAMIEFLYATGIRSEELRTIKVADYDMTEHKVFVTGKGSKDRIIPVGTWVAPFVHEYLQKCRPVFTRKNNPELLFVSVNGQMLSRSNLWYTVNKYAKQAGVQGVMPHGLRHACATHLLHNGADIRMVQELLGHRSLASTQIYTKVDIHTLQQAHSRFHPREKW